MRGIIGTYISWATADAGVTLGIMMTLMIIWVMTWAEYSTDQRLLFSWLGVIVITAPASAKLMSVLSGMWATSSGFRTAFIIAAVIAIAAIVRSCIVMCIDIMK